VLSLLFTGATDRVAAQQRLGLYRISTKLILLASGHGEVIAGETVKSAASAAFWLARIAIPSSVENLRSVSAASPYKRGPFLKVR